MLFEPRQTFLGLDISDRSLKAVQFVPSLRGQQRLKGLGYIDLAPGVFDEGKLKQPAAFVQALKQMLSNPRLGKFTTAYTVASLPESKTFIKLIDIAPLPEADIPEAVRSEAEHHIPIPIDETYWDWQQMGGGTKTNARLPILLGVAPKTIVESYAQALEQAELVPAALQIEAVAITRSLLPLDQNVSTSGAMVIDIGATRTSLIVFDQNSIQFTVSLPISGRQITEIIASTLKLSEIEAEKAKILCGLDPKKCRGAMAQILHNVMDELLHRINESLSFYQEHFPQSHKVTQLILCGGGSNFRAIDDYLSQSLGLPVVRGNPWRNLEPTKPPLKPDELISFTTAIGLALQNLLPEQEL